jgi:hypothetical protein
MTANKKYPEKAAFKLNSVSEEELEDVLFTFLDEVNKAKVENAEKRKRKFTEMLVQLGPTEAAQFLSVLGQGLGAEQALLSSSPTVGDVIRKFMEVQLVSVDDLANKLGSGLVSIQELMHESYRVSEEGLKDVVTSLAMKHKIGNETILRQVVATGYRLFALKPSTVGPVRIAARKKGK